MLTKVNSYSYSYTKYTARQSFINRGTKESITAKQLTLRATSLETLQEFCNIVTS